MKSKFTLVALLAGLMFTCVVHAEEHIAGIGVALAVRDHAVTIMQVLPDTPAAKAGLSRGLILQTIDGVPAKDGELKQCVDRMRGAAGTKVKLELVDPGRNKTNTVELVREEIKL